MNKVILDASAVLALMNTESGHEQVVSVLEQSLISSVNACEVLSELHEKLKMPIEEAAETLSFLVSEIIPFNLEQSLIAATLKPKTKEFGLSLGDRACLALGKQYGVAVYTADKIWSKLHLGIKIIVIR